jgi:hypothetical protein
MSQITAFLEEPSGNAYLPVEEREYSLKQCRCLDALDEYFAEARKTVELIRQCQSQPRGIAQQLQIMAQRDREAEAQRSYTQARKLLLHTAKVSCVPSKRNDG